MAQTQHWQRAGSVAVSHRLGAVIHTHVSKGPRLQGLA
jgi:hypothetical protein